MKHLAIFKWEGADLILSGKKTIESRFSTKKSVPFQAISAGDLVYIKPSGKEIIGEFRVKKVIFIDGMDQKDVQDIKQKYGAGMAMDQAWWEKKSNSKYATIIFIGNVSHFLTSPLKIPKKDLRGWVVLD